MPLRFTHSADRAVFFATVEAARSHQRWIRPEHLLVGLVQDADGPAAELLVRLGVSLSQVRRAAKRAALAANGDDTGGLALDSRAELVVTLARAEARRLGYRHVGPEDILVGLIREGESSAAQILSDAGVSLDTVSEGIRHRATTAPPLPLRVDWAWHRLRDRARQVILRADGEAGRRGETLVTPEHLLLALVLEDESLAARVLQAAGIATSQVREAVEARLPAAATDPATVPRAMDPRADEVLHRALAEVSQSGDRRVGTEHLLLGIAGEASGAAAEVLAGLGVTPETVHRGVEQCLGEQGTLRAAIEERLRLAVSHRP